VIWDKIIITLRPIDRVKFGDKLFMLIGFFS